MRKVAHSAAHRWYLPVPRRARGLSGMKLRRALLPPRRYYFPRVTPAECVLLKTFDSRDDDDGASSARALLSRSLRLALSLGGTGPAHARRPAAAPKPRPSRAGATARFSLHSSFQLPEQRARAADGAPPLPARSSLEGRTGGARARARSRARALSLFLSRG